MVNAQAPSNNKPVLETEGLWIRYGDHAAVQNVSLSIPERQVTALIGPSGCGKSTLLRVFNRMNDFIPNVSTEGVVRYHGRDLYAKDVDAVEVRRRIGMVFQKPNPFPKSISKNISWGPLINGFKGDVDELVRVSLERAALWEEVKTKLNESGLALSGGQQQRLC
ncbi:MAG: ATP-binding cassette domain-containing protein, partial [Myxococcales bacterium]|nr:ATP-binding cassette domain-containing protein [Myxococcales bacterium]